MRFYILGCMLLLLSCEKKEGASEHETFIRNYYGIAYQMEDMDTLQQIEAHIRLTLGKDKAVFSSKLIPEANETFDINGEGDYIQVDMMSQKEFKRQGDSLFFNYYKRLGVTKSWQFRGVQQ